MMEINVFSRKDISAVVELWNRCVGQKDMCYAPITEESFRKVFLESVHSSEEYMLSAKEEGKIIGFAAGLIKRQYLQDEDFFCTPAYLTMILVEPEKRRQGVGSALLKELEKRFWAIGKKKIAVTYRNPMTLTWIVPQSKGAEHNNAPGVEFHSPAYEMFQKYGYRMMRIEDGMFLSLDGFQTGESVRKKEERLLQENIVIEQYDADRHGGFEELFDALHGEVWRDTIRRNQQSQNPLPILVAADREAACLEQGVKKQKIVGFAGPVDRENNGRGWFNGIAVSPDYERRGIASVLFCRLMEEFKHIGASYSTLFTDEGNPALNLYLSTGFEVARRFAVMEKERKE